MSEEELVIELIKEWKEFFNNEEEYKEWAKEQIEKLKAQEGE